MNGRELSCTPYCRINSLSYTDEEFLFEKNGEMYISRDNTKRRIAQDYTETMDYSFSEGYTVEFDENKFIVSGDNKTIETNISDKSNWIIRKVLVREERLTLLLNDSTQAAKNKLISYDLLSLVNIKDNTSIK